jgi:hypothetical protein
MRRRRALTQATSAVRLAKVRAFRQISSHKLLILKSLSG